MKRLVMIIAIITLLTSCVPNGEEVIEDSYLPRNDKPPISGSWEVKDYIGEGYSNRTTADFPLEITDRCLFHADAVVIGNSYVLKPVFRVRQVDVSDYLIQKYRTNASDLQIDREEVLVVNIMDENRQFAELIFTDDNTVLLPVEEGFYKLKKLTEQVALAEVERYIYIEENINRDIKSQQKNTVYTGLWLGIKSETEENGLPTWNYHTYFIPSENGVPVNVWEIPKLLVPRRTGFYEINVNRVYTPDQISDKIELDSKTGEENISTLEKQRMVQADQDLKTTPYILKEVDYVGGDFISIERYDPNKNMIGIFALDILDETQPIKLSDLIPDGKNRFIQSEEKNLPEGIVPQGNDENIGIVRHQGYWNLRGRTYYRDKGEEVAFDFSIDTAVPQDIITYDQSIIPWSELNMVIPNVEDAYSSPNHEFIAVLKAGNLYIHSVKDFKVDKDYLVKIELPENSTVVMAEWSLEDYVEKWSDEMIKHNATDVLPEGTDE